MSFSRTHTTTLRSPLANALPTPSSRQIYGPPSIRSSQAPSINTRSAIPIRRPRQSNAQSTTRRPTEDITRNQPELTSFRHLREAVVLDGNFVNTTGDVNIHSGVPSGETLNNHRNVAVGSNTCGSNAAGPSQNAEYDIYYNQLLVKKRGSPLWEPGPQMMFPTEYRRNGVSIGDVGILYRTGDFAFLFNIFLPADHEINEGRVPNGFIPLDKSKVEKSIKKCVVYDRGSCLASSSLRRTDSSDFTFQTTGSEGAVLVMPEGAMTEDLRNQKLVEKYVADNAKSWYKYVESDDCGMQTENGDIRVVIGMDKVSSWGMATFENVDMADPLLFEFREDERRESQVRTYKWDRIVAGRAGPPEAEIRDLLQEPNMFPLQNQCVFVPTLNISVAGKVRDELAAYEVRSSSFRDCHSDLNQHGNPSGRGNVNLQSSQIGLTVPHPSKILNKYLLEKCPNAEVVITKDSDWMSVITEDDATTPSFEDICARVLASHVIREKDGVVTLKKRKVVFGTWSAIDPCVITSPACRLPIAKEEYVIGRLLLEAPEDQSLVDSLDSEALPVNDAMEHHRQGTFSNTVTNNFEISGRIFNSETHMKDEPERLPPPLEQHPQSVFINYLEIYDGVFTSEAHMKEVLEQKEVLEPSNPRFIIDDTGDDVDITEKQIINTERASVTGNRRGRFKPTCDICRIRNYGPWSMWTPCLSSGRCAMCNCESVLDFQFAKVIEPPGLKHKTFTQKPGCKKDNNFRLPCINTELDVMPVASGNLPHRPTKTLHADKFGINYSHLFDQINRDADYPLPPYSNTSSPKGRFLVSGSIDPLVGLWDGYDKKPTECDSGGCDKPKHGHEHLYEKLQSCCDSICITEEQKNILQKATCSLGDALSQVPWMKFRLIAEPNMDCFSSDIRLRTFIRQITELTVSIVTKQCTDEITILMDILVANLTCSMEVRIKLIVETIIEQIKYLCLQDTVTACHNLDEIKEKVCFPKHHEHSKLRNCVDNTLQILTEQDHFSPHPRSFTPTMVLLCQCLQDEPPSQSLAHPPRSIRYPCLSSDTHLHTFIRQITELTVSIVTKQCTDGIANLPRGDQGTSAPNNRTTVFECPQCGHYHENPCYIGRSSTTCYIQCCRRVFKIMSQLGVFDNDCPGSRS